MTANRPTPALPAKGGRRGEREKGGGEGDVPVGTDCNATL